MPFFCWLCNVPSDSVCCWVSTSADPSISGIYSKASPLLYRERTQMRSKLFLLNQFYFRYLKDKSNMSCSNRSTDNSCSGSDPRNSISTSALRIWSLVNPIPWTSRMVDVLRWSTSNWHPKLVEGVALENGNVHVATKTNTTELQKLLFNGFFPRLLFGHYR